MFLTLVALLAGLLFLEAALSTFMPAAWRIGRWFMLPLYGVALADILPVALFLAPAFLDAVTSYLLALVLAGLVATGGHFRDALWRGPTQAELARTGRRSVYEHHPQALRPAAVRMRRA